jgi:hypothetical protein
VQAALKRDELLQHLLGMLSDDDLQARRTAAITLGWLKEPRAVRPLLELLLEPSCRSTSATRWWRSATAMPTPTSDAPAAPGRPGAPGRGALPGLDRAEGRDLAGGAARSTTRRSRCARRR